MTKISFYTTHSTPMKLIGSITWPILNINGLALFAKRPFSVQCIFVHILWHSIAHTDHIIACFVSSHYVKKVSWWNMNTLTQGLPSIVAISVGLGSPLLDIRHKPNKITQIGCSKDMSKRTKIVKTFQINNIHLSN